jgi:ribonuclease G
VDFIDLREEKNRKKIFDELKKEFKKDRAKTNVIGMSDFGLIQITRQRIRPSVVNSVSKVCPSCGGLGTIVTQDTIMTDLEGWISKFRTSTDYRVVDLYVNPYLKSHLQKGFFSLQWKWMVEYKLRITVIADDSISLNEFKATLTGSEVDITEAVIQGESIDALLKKASDSSVKKESDDQLEYYSKDSDEPKDSSARSNGARSTTGSGSSGSNSSGSRSSGSRSHSSQRNGSQGTQRGGNASQRSSRGGQSGGRSSGSGRSSQRGGRTTQRSDSGDKN